MVLSSSSMLQSERPSIPARFVGCSSNCTTMEVAAEGKYTSRRLGLSVMGWRVDRVTCTVTVGQWQRQDAAAEAAG